MVGCGKMAIVASKDASGEGRENDSIESRQLAIRLVARAVNGPD